MIIIMMIVGDSPYSIIPIIWNLDYPWGQTGPN